MLACRDFRRVSSDPGKPVPRGSPRFLVSPAVPVPAGPVTEQPPDHRGGFLVPADSELAAEQAHLAASRAQLDRMRERTASLDSAAASDWVSREYLESAFALRMKQLAEIGRAHV